MSEQQNQVPGLSGPGGLPVSGGAAIVAPAQAFQGGIPPNALIVVPLAKPTDEFLEKIKEGPLVIEPAKMWEMLGFNGPAVTVQDQNGRPVTIGLEDLLSTLEKAMNDAPQDKQRARVYASELMKYGRTDKAEEVLAKLVASGGGGDDWLGLGIAQLNNKKLDKAEATLKGAQSLLKTNPFPSLHLGKLYKEQGNATALFDSIKAAIAIDANCVDAWAFLYSETRATENEEAALNKLRLWADEEANKKSAAPFVAAQGFYANQPETREKALELVKEGVSRNGDDVLALVCLSALYGQSGKVDEALELLSKHETAMSRDVRLANNYFEALMQKGHIDRVTKLLNGLAGSSQPEIRQFAMERSRLVAQMLQQQQQRPPAS